MNEIALLLGATLNAGTVLAIAGLGLLINERAGIVVDDENVDGFAAGLWHVRLPSRRCRALRARTARRCAARAAWSWMRVVR